MKLGFAVAALLVSQGSPAPVPILFASEDVRAHLIGNPPLVEEPAPSPNDNGEVEVRVIVAPDGSVRQASVAERYGKLDTASVLAAARSLRFRPFTYRGARVTGGGLISIRYGKRGVGGWRDPNADLPPIDYATLRISLVRSACYGSCPDYNVTIEGNGNVLFSTQSQSLPGAPQAHRAYSTWNGVLIPGTHRARIDRATLDALIGKFRAAHFFGLRPDYQSAVTDSPTYQLIFESGGRRWSVDDYVGRDVGMPAVVSELEDAVDAAAGTARWVTGDAQSVPMLIAEGLDPASEEAANLAALSAFHADERVAIGLIDAGVRLDRSVKLGQRAAPLWRLLLESAATNGKGRLLAAVAAKGWLARMSKRDLEKLLVASGGGCDIEASRAILAAGADPNAVDPETDGSLGSDGTVLRSAAHSYQCNDQAAKRTTVMGLIALGADVNARNAKGESVIFGVEDTVLLDQLLDAGARVDVKDKDGNSAAFGSWTDAIVLRLLDAGADPHGYYDYGGRRKTMRQMARERDMPAVLAWLDAHGVK